MRVVIVEDEPVIGQRLQRMLSELLKSEKPKIIYFDNLDDAEGFLSEQAIDLLFLDLNLHGADGFELLKSITAASFHTVIVSAYAEKAIKAFRYGVLDFIAKPFNQQRLQQAVERYLDINSRSDYGARQLAVKKASGLLLIKVEEIIYIKADGHYTQVYLNQQQLLHDKSIEKLTKLLPANFERIHRSYTVNMNCVVAIKIQSGGSYQVELDNQQFLPVSRSNFSRIRQKLEN